MSKARKKRATLLFAAVAAGLLPCVAFSAAAYAAEFPKPYDKGCTEREDVFAFTKKPTCRYLGNDKYEIAFAVKGYCDVTVGIVDAAGKVVRHLASGVLGKNAPPPFQKNSLTQKIYWNGKDDLSHYPMDPGKLRVRVMLGLKPVFDKRLGGTSPYNVPGYVWGLAVAPDAAYVFVKGAGSAGHVTVRKFDRDGKYLQTLVPPPASLPESKLGGLAYVEYERGKRARHGMTVRQTVQRDGMVLPGVGGQFGAASCQPVIFKQRLIFSNAGSAVRKGAPSVLHYIYTDGSTDIAGIKGRPLLPGQGHSFPRFAISPDGRRLYLVGIGTKMNATAVPAVYVRQTAGKEPARIFFGGKKSGTDNKHLSVPVGVDCDKQGRVYVSDHRNNRIVVLSPEGKFLKQIKIDRPNLLRVHQKTGAIYVLHSARIRGKSIGRLSKLASFDNPRVTAHLDGVNASAAAVDSWSAKPRLWLGGGKVQVTTVAIGAEMTPVRVFEESGKTFRKILDFDVLAKKEDGPAYFGRWSGNRGHGFPRVTCDPVREQVYMDRRQLFDLKTGAYLGYINANAYGYEDIDFDKHGYLHLHFNPGSFTPGVGRVDPSRGKWSKDRAGRKFIAYPEVPYDYGVNGPGKYGKPWLGILPVKDQPGAKYFQDGLGVNMRGDIAVESNIYYVPKMEKAGYEFAQQGVNGRKRAGEYGGGKAGAWSYAKFMKEVQMREARGEKIYSIPRRPGVSLAGGTIWTFDWTGELRRECAVSAGRFIASSMIDEDGAIYFVTSRTRMIGGRPFLAGQGGTFGLPKDKINRYPFTGTLIKTKPGEQCLILNASSPIKLTTPPARPADMMNVSFEGIFGKGLHSWVQGAEWLYAGASGIVSNSCSCPTMRIGLDWYKRVFVPETYRHSIAVLDSAGNLVLHLGRYGNFDSASGPKSRLPVGGDGIGIFFSRFVSTTDNYMAFEDWGERIVILKLQYHAEETVPVRMR